MVEPSGLQALIQSEDAVLAYFSTPTCAVCQVLRPRVEALIAQRFPRVVLRYVDCEAEPAVAGQLLVFAVPTLVVFFAGREVGRLSRVVGLGEIEALIARPYCLMYS